MKAVNLIPVDQRRGAGGAAGRAGGAVYVLLGGLAVLVVMSVLYAVSASQVNDRQTKLARVTAEAGVAQTQASSLQPYVTFASIRQTREQAITSLANNRFDWAAAMDQIARSLPSDVTLSAMTGSPPATSAAAPTAPTAPTAAAPPAGPTAADRRGRRGGHDDPAGQRPVGGPHGLRAQPQRGGQRARRPPRDRRSNRRDSLHLPEGGRVSHADHRLPGRDVQRDPGVRPELDHRSSDHEHQRCHGDDRGIPERREHPMKPRDRLVVCVLVAVAGLAAIWIGVISPKRHDAAQLGSKLTVAQTQLGTAETQLAQAKAAEAQYPENLRVVKSLYKAVPADDGVPRLLVSLDKTSQYKRVDFKVITVAGAAGAAGAASAAAASLPAGLSPVSFTFTFSGGYIALQHFLKSVTGYTLVRGSKVVAHGRLLTISSVALTPVQATGVSATPTVTGTQAAVTATAYSQQPASSAATPGSGTTTAAAPNAPTTSSAVPASTTTPTTR